MEINNIKEECDKLRKENAELRDAQKRCNEAEAKVKSLYEEITEKTRAYIKLQEEVSTTLCHCSKSLVTVYTIAASFRSHISEVG